jgi:hypothetical protein
LYILRNDEQTEKEFSKTIPFITAFKKKKYLRINVKNGNEKPIQ